METIIKDKKLSIKQIMFKGLRVSFRILSFIIDAWAASARSKKYEPTMQEKLAGKKILLSDKYYIPNNRH